MKKICDFIINNKIYSIYDINEIEGRESIVGRSTYNDGEILIEEGTFEQMLLTLKHELMHVWLYENGHKNQTNDETFGYEDVCELVALSNSSINRIVEEYIISKYK